jgi:hypothetical protein
MMAPPSWAEFEQRAHDVARAQNLAPDFIHGVLGRISRLRGDQTQVVPRVGPDSGEGMMYAAAQKRLASLQASVSRCKVELQSREEELVLRRQEQHVDTEQLAMLRHRIQEQQAEMQRAMERNARDDRGGWHDRAGARVGR